MISLQSHNQVLYHLTQLTSALNGKSTPFTIKVQKQNASVSSNANNMAHKNITKQTTENYMELPKIKLNTLNINTIRTKRNNVWIILDKLSAHNSQNAMEKNCKWNVSYVSGSSFKENKQSFPCSQLTESVILPAIFVASKHQCKTNNDMYKKSFFTYNIQIRGFKTRRSIKAELDRDSSLNSTLKRWLPKSVVVDLAKLRSNPESGQTKIKRLKTAFDNPDLSEEQRLKLKAAFTDGYVEGSEKPQRPRPLTTRILWSFIVGFVITMCCWFWINTTGSVFKFSLGNKTVVDPEEIHVTFNDVKGVDEAKQELQDVVEFLKNPEKFSALGGKLPKGVLLVGPPGTGKTLLARAVAGEAGVPFFHAAGPEFDEILVGQGARRVRDLFKAAKDRAPCVVFIDEIDSVGGKRTSTTFHPYANQTINQLLSEMDGFHQNDGVIVLGATNRRDDLDKAILRPGRFDIEIQVNTPNIIGRKEILDLYLSRILSRDIDADYLARGTTGCTGADLESIVNQAALKAAIDGAEFVTMEHLEYARDKVLMGPEGKLRSQDDEVNRLTAYHEGGHALVAYYTKDAMPIHKVTIIPRGPSLGHTSFIPAKDMYHITKSQLLAQMDTMMGGRAAEDIIYGSEKVTTGASSDFQEATRLAENMVKIYGMSEKLGFRSYQDSNAKVYGGPGLDYSPNTVDAIDTEIKRLLQESYERAKTIIRNHAKEHKQLVEALLTYETLDAKEVKAILNGQKINLEQTGKKPILDTSNNLM